MRIYDININSLYHGLLVLLFKLILFKVLTTTTLTFQKPFIFASKCFITNLNTQWVGKDEIRVNFA